MALWSSISAIVVVNPRAFEILCEALPVPQGPRGLRKVGEVRLQALEFGNQPVVDKLLANSNLVEYELKIHHHHQHHHHHEKQQHRFTCD
eukprot:1244452-Amphidinium_carterae.2